MAKLYWKGGWRRERDSKKLQNCHVYAFSSDTTIEDTTRDTTTGLMLLHRFAARLLQSFLISSAVTFLRSSTTHTKSMS